MKIYTKIIVNIANNTIVKCETFDYTGPLAEAISFGGQKSGSKSQSQSTSQSGTQFNPEFMSDFLTNLGLSSRKKTTSQDISNQLAPLEQEYNAIPESGRNYPHAQDLGKRIATLRQQREAIDAQGGAVETGIPDYSPQYVRGAYTPGQFTSVAPEGFQRLEDVLYGSQAAKINQDYNTQVAQQREQLAQTGALNDPAQFLEGSTRSALDRSRMNAIQQAAYGAAGQRLGAEQAEAGRRTEFDVGQGAARTAYDVGEAGRETGFNQQTAAANLERFFKLLQAAIDSGRYSTGTSTSTGMSSGIGGQFGIGGGGAGGQMYGDVKNWMS